MEVTHQARWLTSIKLDVIGNACPATLYSHHLHLHQLWPEAVIEFRGFTEAKVSEARQQIVDMALQVGFEEVDEDDVEDLLLSDREELSNEDLWALEEKRIREESESSPLEFLPVKTLTVKVIAKGFNLVDEAMAIFDEHNPECMRSSKGWREMENVLKCYKEVYNQKMKAATQVSIMKFFKKSLLEEETP